MQITKYGLQLKLLNFALSSDLQTYGFLTYFSPMFHFYAPWNCQEAKGFLTFLEGIKMEHWAKMG